MVKHVMIDEGSNKVKEYQFSELEKQTKAYSKEELARFRQQFQAESILEKVRGMVTRIMIQKANHHSGQNVTPQMVQPQVNQVMNKNIDEILNFLAENGVKLPPPPPPPPPRAAPTPTGSQANGEHKLRQMVQQKLLKETELRGAALANKVDLVMSLPRPKILSILQSELPPPPPPRGAPRSATPGMQKKSYNWIKECNDFWSYLPPPVQEALKVLGYNETLWNKNEQPPSSDKAYPDLTPQQQKAVRILGCTPQEWDETDEEDVPPPPPAPPAGDDSNNTSSPPKKPISPEERAMMLKVKEMVTFKLRTELGLTGNDPSESLLLNRAVMEILNLEKEGVEEYLKRPMFPPHIAEQFQPPAPATRNWVWDSKAYWVALPPHIQEAAKVLGYDEDAWNNTEQPEESDMKWRHLSIRQQEAAITLGYTQEAWDEGDRDDYFKHRGKFADDSDEEDQDPDVAKELDSDDESDEFSEEEKEEVADEGDDDDSDEEEEFISNFIEPQDEDDNAEELIANFISKDPKVVRELSKKDEVLDDDSVDGTDIPYVSNSILRNDSSDDDDDDDDFYTNFRSEGKNRSGDPLTEDETETTEEKDPDEQKFSSQLETFMSLWSFKL